MGAKKCLNGTSKVNRRTHGRTFRLIERIGPEGRCFEMKEKIIGAVLEPTPLLVTANQIYDCEEIFRFFLIFFILFGKYCLQYRLYSVVQ